MTALAVREAAAYLNIGLSTFRALVADGQIARVGTPGRHLFLIEDLDDWQRRSRVPSKAERDAKRFVGRRDPVGQRPDPKRVAEIWGTAR